MKINVYINKEGYIYQTEQGSEADKYYATFAGHLVLTYEIAEPKPIINPHMKPERPSYGEARKLIHDFFYKFKSVSELLSDLGFERESEE